MQDLDSLSLDELFKEARAALGAQRAQAGAPRRSSSPSGRRGADAPATPAYFDSANWTKTRGVALIHQETRTVIGNFTEYTHKALPGARRLIRETEVLPFTSVEYVTGVWGVAPSGEPIKTPRLWHTKRFSTIDAVLKDMHVSAPQVEVEACFGEGVLEQVLLREVTTFSSPPAEGVSPSFCVLPEGVNILPELSIHSIKQLLLNLNQPT